MVFTVGAILMEKMAGLLERSLVAGTHFINTISRFLVTFNIFGVNYEILARGNMRTILLKIINTRQCRFISIKRDKKSRYVCEKWGNFDCRIPLNIVTKITLEQKE